MGKVKTRLAASIGDKKALDVYQILVNHTLNITRTLRCDRIVYYSDFIPDKDEWLSAEFMQALQFGQDLGQRMKYAFENGFKCGYSRIVIIGSDCFDLSNRHISEAFEYLENSNVVIGPAKDGGYYLLGMTKLYDELFKNKKWSTDSVYLNTIENLHKINISYRLLEQLNDIDTQSDLENSKLPIE